MITTSTEINLRLYMASAITPAGDLRYMIRNQPFDSATVIEFVEYLLECFQRKLLIVWDGASIHHSKAFKEYLNSKNKGELHLVMQPHYSPELNADEQVWNYLKQHKLKNTCNPNWTELKEKINCAMQTLQQQPSIIQNFFHHPDLGYYG